MHTRTVEHDLILTKNHQDTKDTKKSPQIAQMNADEKVICENLRHLRTTNNSSADVDRPAHWQSQCHTTRRSSFILHPSSFHTHPSSFRLHPSGGARRGVLLLVVLGLLTIFTLLCITFVLVARQTAVGSRAAAAAEQYQDPPDVLLNMAIFQAIRSSDNRRSVIGPHGLLEDIYGSDGVRFRIPPAIPPAVPQPVPVFDPGGQMLSLLIETDPEFLQFSPEDTINDYYNGRVLTMLSGPAAGHSTRITGYTAAAANRNLRVMAFENGQRPLQGDRFLINGRPFNGTGFGYEPTKFAGPNRLLDANDGNPAHRDLMPPLQPWEYALLPNPVFFEATVNPGEQYDDPAGNGGADEDYDIPDFQNMLLAMQVSQGPGLDPVVPIPSLHRPALVNYWINRASADGSFAGLPSDLRRKIMLRPVGRNMGNATDPPDHPDFTGSNPTFNPVDGPWDVDNNGDGRPDSVWVDIGLPVQTAPDGRQYKPLVAYLVIDLDGRLNLNAHGNTSHYTDANNPLADPPYYFARQYPAYYPLPDPAMNADPTLLSPGAGYSVADINLGAILPDPYPDAFGNTMNEYRQLLQGRLPMDVDGDGTLDPVIAGRYGEEHILRDPADTRLPQAGLTSSRAWMTGLDGGWGDLFVDDNLNGINDDIGEAGWMRTDDTLNIVALPGDDNLPVAPAWSTSGSALWQFRGNFHYEGVGLAQITGMNAIGTPPDLDGNGAVAIDPRGQPYFAGMGTPRVNGSAIGVPEAIDEPAEIDLSLRAQYMAPDRGGNAGDTIAVDDPFTPADLELLLRPYDLDVAAMPNRIVELAPSFASNPFLRSLATSESWDLPSPSITPTPEIAAGLRQLGISPASVHITDLLRGKLRALNPMLTLPLVDAQVAILLDPRPVPLGPRPQRQEILAPELLAGLRFDLNRPFGNGQDDPSSPNGVPDDPVEGDTETLWQDSVLGAPGVWFDNNNDGVAKPDPLFQDRLARYRYAKQLYVLMMLLKPDQYAQGTAEAGLSPLDARNLTIRRLAQWCVNVVDFRDADSIMTPFEYDANPFDGWSVDGDLATNEGGDRRVVWGCEYPPLLLTETVAFHDRRVEDLANDDGDAATTEDNDGDMVPDDNDFDQRRMPEGSAFIELYCTLNPRNTNFTGDLFDNFARFELSKMAPPDVAGIPSPVWRLAISDSRIADPNNDAFARVSTTVPNAETKPDSTSLEPDRFTLLPPPEPDTPVDIERIVWFTSQAPTPGHPDRNKIYYSRLPVGIAVFLEPGQYILVGPERLGQERATKIGWTARTDPPPQQITLDPVEVTYNGDDLGYMYPRHVDLGTPPAQAEIKRPIGIPVAGQHINAQIGAVGLSISEPLFSSVNYYPAPTDVNPTIDPHDMATTIDKYLQPFDVPLDSRPTSPLKIDNLLGTGTTRRYKTVFLQRLANPLEPWNQTLNPYLTIDWMPIDLTVFNGQPDNLATLDPEDVSNAQAQNQNVEFMTRQRGAPRPPAQSLPPNASIGLFNLWVAEWPDPDPTNPAPNRLTLAFGHLLDHTAGYLNAAYHYTYAMSPRPSPWLQKETPPTNPYGQARQTYVGDPWIPFPWLTWNNRPFANAMELLQVPASSSARLLWDYTVRRPIVAKDHYDERDDEKPSAPYGHLMNFFFSSNVGQDESVPAQQTSGNFHRLFEFVHVPSRFSGTDMLLDPRVFQAGSPGDLYPYYAPFNRVSNYRDPGRVNINTIFDDGTTWRGIMNGLDQLDATWGTPAGRLWTKIRRSRQGVSLGAVPYPLTAPIRDSNGDNVLFLHDQSPTFFANPFRSFGSTYLVPIEALRRQDANPGGAPREMVETSFLRPDPTDLERPLFAFQAKRHPDPTMPPGILELHNDSDRNPYFRYQAFIKLGNSVTTRSNVYAIWVTVGFFEVTPGLIDPGHPDGFRLGRELGSDSGEINRHRAFAIFDRTIPVAFERGKNHNVEKGILVKRIIE